MSKARTSDPLWAIRWGKRMLLLVLVTLLVILGLMIVWRYLPEHDPKLRLELSTKTEVFAQSESLGTGDVVLESEDLLRIGSEVPAASTPEQIADVLFPRLTFVGPYGEGPLLMGHEHLGFQLFIRDKQQILHIYRVWMFDLGNGTELAVPLEFRHDTRPLTKVDSVYRSFGWTLKWPLAKQYRETQSAIVLGAEGEVPGPGEVMLGPLIVPAD